MLVTSIFSFSYNVFFFALALNLDIPRNVSFGKELTMKINGIVTTNSVTCWVFEPTLR